MGFSCLHAVTTAVFLDLCLKKLNVFSQHIVYKKMNTNPEQLTGAHLYLDIAKSGYLFHGYCGGMKCWYRQTVAPWWCYDMKTLSPWRATGGFSSQRPTNIGLEQISELPVIRDTMALMWRRCRKTVKCHGNVISECRYQYISAFHVTLICVRAASSTLNQNSTNPLMGQLHLPFLPDMLFLNSRKFNRKHRRNEVPDFFVSR